MTLDKKKVLKWCEDEERDPDSRHLPMHYIEGYNTALEDLRAEIAAGTFDEDRYNELREAAERVVRSRGLDRRHEDSVEVVTDARIDSMAEVIQRHRKDGG